MAGAVFTHVPNRLLSARRVSGRQSRCNVMRGVRSGRRLHLEVLKKTGGMLMPQIRDRRVVLTGRERQTKAADIFLMVLQFKRKGGNEDGSIVFISYLGIHGTL